MSKELTCELCSAMTPVYEEGTVLSLSNEQLNLLRRAKGIPEKALETA